ncbi:MAG: hypothetical protein ACRDYA_17455 [Egibacteraceae bacterium]
MGERSGRPPPRPVPQAGAGVVVVVGRWSDGLAGALRAALRDSLDDFAVRLGVGTSTAGDWDDSPGIVPQAVNQRALDELLRRADDEARRRFDLLTRGDPLVRVADLSGLDGNGVGTDRRHVTKGAAAAGVVTALAPLEALERIAAQDGYPVDAGLVAAHEKFADALADLGPTTTRLGPLAAQVADQADGLLALLDRPMAEADRRRVEAAVVGSCAQAGMTVLCMGDRRLARGCFALARSVAEDSGDDVLRAQALGVGAILLSPLLPGGGWGGDPRRFARTLSEAVRYARDADPHTRATLQWWLAVALATKRDECGFRRAIEAADRLAGRVGVRDGAGWLTRHFVSASGSQERAKSLGEGLLLLGQPGPAVEALTQALASVDPSIGTLRVVLLVEIAAARVLQGEPEAACAGLLEALDLAERFGHGMGVQRVVGVRTTFRPEWTGLDCVRELDDRLRPAA